MRLAVCVFLCGLAGITVMLAVRIRSSRAWARELHRFRLYLPAGLTTDDVARWLGMVAASTSVPQWTSRPPSVIGVEICATARGGIQHYLLVPKHVETSVLQTLRAGLPGARLEAAPESAGRALQIRYARELMLTSSRRPLVSARAEATATAFLASLQPLTSGQEVRAEWYIGGAGTPKLPRVRPAHADQSYVPWLDRGEAMTAQAVHAQRTKDQQPLLLTSIRIGASGSTTRHAQGLVARATATLRGMNAPGVRITDRRWMPSAVVAGRMARHALPLNSWLLINADELSGLIGLPVGAAAYLPGLALGTSRQLPPNPAASRTGVVLGRSTYQGAEHAIRLSALDRLRHLWLLGPTGTGKSTLIANMALQDAAAGHGCVIADPKSDLVADVLVRLPKSRHQDVIVLDPAAYVSDQPVVGLNVLGQARTEHERELATDQIVHIMSSIWADSWGPRTSDVLRNAILTLTHTRAMDGSAFTLVEIPELLTNAAFRRLVTTQSAVPESVRGFWADFERYSEAQRLQIIGPSLNKLRSFSTRTPLRLMLGQSSGLDMADVLNKRKILLVPLAKGTIGSETAALLGSLVVSSLTNAIFARAAVPAAQRHPAFIYLDEFQDVLRLPLDLADALAQARGLGASFTLANQYIGQLSETIKRACFGTVRSTVLYQLDLDDAKVLERRFTPLTASDLQHLPTYEIAARLCEDNAVGRPVTGVTLPLPEAASDGSGLARASAARYGMQRTEVEAAIRARITPPTSTKHASDGPTFGRRKLGGSQ